MKRAPKVIKKGNIYYYKELKTYKYKTKPFTGYIGGYWTWEYDENDNLIQKWLFQVVELSEWQIEEAFLDVLKQWKLI